MITSKHLEEMSLHLSKAESLMSAVSCLMDSIPVDGNAHERTAKDGLFGVIDALDRQLADARAEMQTLFDIERGARHG